MKTKKKKKYKQPPRGYDEYGNRICYRHGYVDGRLAVIEVIRF